MIADLKPYPEYRDSGVPWLGKVPAHWEIRRNGRIFAARKEAGFPLLPILEVSLKTGVRVRDFEGSARKQVMAEREKYQRAAQGDLAYNMMRMWQGAVGVAPVNGLVSPAYVVARPLEGVRSRYYAELYRTPAYMREVINYSRGIVLDRNRFYWDDFKQIQGPHPPPAEQDAIVRFLAYADQRIRRYIHAKRKLIALLDEQKQAIIHRAVTRGLDPNVRLKPSGVEWLGDIPEHWLLSSIGYIAKVGNGSTPSRGNPNFWQGGTFPWLNSSQVNHKRIISADQFVTAEALKQCHLPILRPGNVLVAITGQGKTRGMAAVLEIEATINQHLAFIAPSANISTQFLHLFLEGAYRHLRQLSEAGATKGALTCAHLRRLKVPLPPLSEQAKLVDGIQKLVKSFDLGRQTASKEIDLLREYRTRLIADVVTGKLDVRAAAAALPADVEELAEVELDEEEGSESADLLEAAEE